METTTLARTATLPSGTTSVQTRTHVGEALSPQHILQIGMGFWASKTVLTAVGLKLFTLLAKRPLSATDIRKELKLHERSYLDFLDSLVALHYLERTGLGADAVYSNTAETDFFLDANKPSYLGGIMEMSNNRLFRFWNDFEEGLKTGLPQNELKFTDSKTQFDDFYSTPEAVAGFMQAWAGLQMGAFVSFVKQFDLSRYATFCDIGGGGGALSIQVAVKNPQIRCITFDVAAVRPAAKATIERAGLSSRIETVSGDFFKDDLPKADVLCMGNILHNWNEQEKLQLMKRAYDALPQGGAFVCIENIIDNDRRENAFGLLMSLNMLIETKGGFDYTFNDFDRWAHQTGFTRTDWLSLAGPTSAAIAYK